MILHFFEAETCWPGVDLTLLGGQDEVNSTVLFDAKHHLQKF